MWRALQSLHLSYDPQESPFILVWYRDPSTHSFCVHVVEPVTAISILTTDSYIQPAHMTYVQTMHVLVPSTMTQTWIKSLWLFSLIKSNHLKIVKFCWSVFEKIMILQLKRYEQDCIIVIYYRPPATTICAAIGLGWLLHHVRVQDWRRVVFDVFIAPQISTFSLCNYTRISSVKLAILQHQHLE